MGNNCQLPEPCIDCCTWCFIGSLDASDASNESVAKSKEERSYNRFVKQLEKDKQMREKELESTSKSSSPEPQKKRMHRKNQVENRKIKSNPKSKHVVKYRRKKRKTHIAVHNSVL